MQLRLHPKSNKRQVINRFIIRTILFALVLTLSIYLLDKIEVSAPIKLIEHKISNDKIITLK
jgi:hypothetical protein